MFVKYKMTGFEPEKVAALNKQSGGLFVASESLSESESQLVCKAKPMQTGILSSRPLGIVKKQLSADYSIFLFKINFFTAGR